VASEDALGEAIGVVVRGVGSQGGDAIEFISCPVEAVAAGLGGYVHHAAPGASVFRGEVAGEHAEFLHGIQGNILTNVRREDVHVLSTVEEKVSAGSSLAIDGNAGAASRQHTLRPVSALGNVPRGLHEVISVAGERRQVHDFPRGNGGGEGLVFRVHLGDFALTRGYFDDFSRASDFQGSIKSDGSADGDLYLSLIDGKAGRLDGYLVSAGLKI